MALYWAIYYIYCMFTGNESGKDISFIIENIWFAVWFAVEEIKEKQ